VTSERPQRGRSGCLFGLPVASGQEQSHDWPGGVAAGGFGESRGGEHRHGPGEYGRSSYPSSLQAGHIDRMSLDRGRPVVTSEPHSRVEQRRADAGAPVVTLDGEAGHPPSPWVVREHLCQRPVARHPRESWNGVRSWSIRQADPRRRPEAPVVRRPGESPAVARRGCPAWTSVSRIRRLPCGGGADTSTTKDRHHAGRIR
jgi:hypothetical protein